MTHRARLKIGLLSATIFQSMAMAAPAWAQEAEIADAAAAAAPATDNDIVVTATRRSTSIQDTPINIAAVSAEALQEQQLDDVKDLGAFVPGITVTDNGPRGAATIVMRGLSASGIGTTGSNSNDAIGTYLGEIPLYLDFKFMDMERVEVLLGPQGTLYGLGTLAGALRYIPNRPDAGKVDWSARGRLFDVGHSKGIGYSTEAVVNLPLVDDLLAFRTSTGYFYTPGFIDYPFLVKTPGVSLPQPGGVDNPLGTPEQQQENFAPAKDLNYERTISTRNQLGLTLDGLDAYFTYAFQQTRTEGRQANGFGVLGEGKYEAPWRYREPSDRKAHLFALELEAEIGDFAELVSATAWTKMRRFSRGDVTDLLLDLDYDYELFPAFAGYTTSYNGKEDQFNQEVRLVSSHGGPLSWVLGAFYNRQKTATNSIETLPGFPEFAASPEGSDIYGGYFDGLVRPDGAEYVSFTRTKTTEKAIFGEATFEVTPQWQVTGGIRYFKYTSSITGGSDTPLTRSGRNRMPYPSLEIAPSRIRSGSTSDDGIVWKANTSYKFTDDLMVYGTYSTGYRIGGVNRVVPCILPIDESEQNLCALPDELEFGPDKTKNIEFGVRGEFFDRRLTTNLSVFQVKWDGIQLGSSTTYGNIGITANAGAAKSEGFDFSFSGRVTDQLTIRGNYSYLDAKLTEDAPGLISVADGEVDALAGDRLPGSAKNSGALGATYTLPVKDDQVAFNWTATYTGGILTEAGARGGGERLPSFVMHRASIMYQGENYEAGIYATNIFDKYAITGTGQDLTRYRQINDGIIGRYYNRAVAQPRVIGIEVRVRY